MHKVVDVNSNEAEELIRFVAAARSRRPEAWRHVERLKAVCTQTPGHNPELRDLLRRIWRLEHEVERLRRQSRNLQERLALQLGPVPQGPRAGVPPAANASDYADSDNA